MAGISWIASGLPVNVRYSASIAFRGMGARGALAVPVARLYGETITKVRRGYGCVVRVRRGLWLSHGVRIEAGLLMV
jgi:hypothetical protein